HIVLAFALEIGVTLDPLALEQRVAVLQVEQGARGDRDGEDCDGFFAGHAPIMARRASLRLRPGQGADAWHRRATSGRGPPPRPAPWHGIAGRSCPPRLRIGRRRRSGLELLAEDAFLEVVLGVEQQAYRAFARFAD